MAYKQVADLVTSYALQVPHTNDLLLNGSVHCRGWFILGEQ